MIRVIAVDDARGTPRWLDQIKASIEARFKDTAQMSHIDPGIHLLGRDHEFEKKSLNLAVENAAKNPCDMFIVDLNLTGEQPKDEAKINLPLDIAEIFRGQNKTAIIFLYSGTLAKFVGNLVGPDGSSKMKGAEGNLKRIFLAQISGFYPRDEVENEILSALQDMPILLQIERFLLIHANRRIRGEESAYRKLTFGDLAEKLRRGDALGQHLVATVVTHGLAALADLHA